jgi:transcriptional regulator with XRE-family HTH domain
MELTTPLDKALRARLRAANPNQTEFARAIGRSPAWLSKYMHGAGVATLDDAVRMLALLIGVDQPRLSAQERRLVKALRAIPEERRDDAAFVMELAAKGYRRGQRPRSTAPSPQTPQTTTRKAHGTR